MSAANFEKAAANSDETDDLVSAITKPGIDNHQVMGIYSKWAKTYEQDLLQDGCGYNPPKVVATSLREILHDNWKNIRILDCGAGTGLGGLELGKLGFTNFDALDASAEMLEEAKKKNVYTHYFQEFLGPKKMDIHSDSYDALVLTGVFCEGHVDHTCFPELIRITKPGGHIVAAMRASRLETDPSLKHLDAEIVKLEKEGRWTVKSKTIKPNYHSGCDGLVYVLHLTSARQ